MSRIAAAGSGDWDARSSRAFVNAWRQCCSKQSASRICTGSGTGDNNRASTTAVVSIRPCEAEIAARARSRPTSPASIKAIMLAKAGSAAPFSASPALRRSSKRPPSRTTFIRGPRGLATVASFMRLSVVRAYKTTPPLYRQSSSQRRLTTIATANVEPTEGLMWSSFLGPEQKSQPLGALD